MSEKLLPCPFCGSSESIEYGNCYEENFRIGCISCAAVTGRYRTLPEAVAAWNKRAVIPLEKKEAVTRNTAVLETAIHLMRVCYDEANRLANHCKDGAARWAMDNLYRAANDAKAGLWDSVESAGLAHTDSVFRNPNPSLSEHDGQPVSATGASSPKDSSEEP